MKDMKSKVFKLHIICSVILAMSLLSGCVSSAGKKAANNAMELMASGAYTEAARQCAVAIGEGIDDEKFIRMSDVINTYNLAMSSYEDGRINDAYDRIDHIANYSDFAIAPDVERLKDKIKKAKEDYDAIDKELEKINNLFDTENYAKAKEEMLNLDELNMTDEQKAKYRTLQSKIDSKSGKILEEERAKEEAAKNNNTWTATQNAPSSQTSSYNNYSLSSAYIMGAESGNVYFWNNSSGQGYSSTLPNRTEVYTTNHSENGRTLVKWNGRYGWITSKYVYNGNIRASSNQSSGGYHIAGASSGNVYVWKSMYGNEYYATISNGTSVQPTGSRGNGRVEIRWGSGYAWITEDYVR